MTTASATHPVLDRPPQDPVPALSSTALDALGERLRSRIDIAGTATVTHPAELRLLKVLSAGAFADFKKLHHLRSSMRMGGRIVEFTHRGSNGP